MADGPETASRVTDGSEHAGPDVGSSIGATVRSDRGVSEFTGVAVLVTMTVLATFSVGLFVLTTEEDPGGPPQANFSYQYIDASSVLIITHDRGDVFDARNLTLRTRRGAVRWDEVAGTNRTAPIGPGATTQLSSNNAYDNNVNVGDNVRIVYTPPGGNETVLSRWDPV